MIIMKVARAKEQEFTAAIQTIAKSKIPGIIKRANQRLLELINVTYTKINHEEGC